MTLSDAYPKQQCKISKSKYLVVKLTELGILCLKIYQEWFTLAEGIHKCNIEGEKIEAILSNYRLDRD